MTETAAALLVSTVDALATRAPAVLAAAAEQMGEITLALHFGDRSHAELRRDRDRLVARPRRPRAPTVEAYFDDRSLNLLFDLERRPVDALAEGSLDVRGERDAVLAVWRVFGLLAQRASGLRVVQALWSDYRGRSPARWGSSGNGNGAGKASAVEAEDEEWSALRFLRDRHHPSDAGTSRENGRARALWDGRAADPWWEPPPLRDADLTDVLDACRARVRDELLAMVPTGEPRAELYDLVRDYPARDWKGLRSTLLLAACAAFGGRAEDAVRTAAAVELFHNAFLVHDDVADESDFRRGLPTLHHAHGVALAVNAGDAMNLLAIDGVLSNLPTLGLARTVALIHEVLRMCRETVEGQAIELGWIRHGTVPERDEDYFRMSTKKTGWYTCISPCRLGAICAGDTDPARLGRFDETFRHVGIAFQIQDDVLNLVGDEALYGKEQLGDLLEGKRTVMLIHLMRGARPAVRKRVMRILAKPRAEKTMDDAHELLREMRRAGSIDYAVEVAGRVAREGARRFEEDLAFLPETEGKGILRQVAYYVTTREL